MRNTLLVSVSAIALIAGAGLSGAQEKGMQGSGPVPAPAQMSPQGGADVKGGAEVKGGEIKGGADVKGGAEIKGGTTGQAPGSKGDREPSRAQPSDAGKSRVQDSGKDAQPKAGTSQAPADTKSGTSATDSKSGTGATTGQGAAGTAGGPLTTEQRTRISTTIRQVNVRPETRVNFNVSVGTVVPRTITLHVLPPRVVEIYPVWRRYRFILVAGEIIIIDPDTYRIVAVLPA